MIETHRRLEFDHFHARITSVGESTNLLIAQVKKAVKASYPKRDSSTVELVELSSVEPKLLFWAARMIAWTVGSYYNTENVKWVSILEQRINES